MTKEQIEAARNKIHDPATARAIISQILQPAKRPVNGEPSYICPCCGHGKNGDGLSFVGTDESRVHCFGCRFSGDVSDVYAEVNDLQKNDLQALEAVARMVGYEIEQKTLRATKSGQNMKPNAALPNREKQEQSQSRAATTQNEARSIPELAKEYAKNLDAPESKAYLERRGLWQFRDILESFSIGYDKSERRITIPSAPSNPQGMEMRAVDQNAQLRYKCPKGAKKALFNCAALYQEIEPENDASRAVFVTEGAFDALSYIVMGYKAVALNSTSNAPLLVKALKEKATAATLILSLDMDTTGAETTKNLETDLKGLNVPYIVAPKSLYNHAKDPNAAMIEDAGAFNAAAWNLITKSKAFSRPDSMLNYFENSYARDLQEFKTECKTGFRNLDFLIDGLYAGLYVLAAIPSLGKTTFAHQMADQIVAQGKPVIFFSLEQSKLELATKSLSRITYQRRTQQAEAMTSLDIRRGKDSEQVKAAISFYRDNGADLMSIVEGNFRCDVSFIGEYVKRYIEQNREKPVVIIDYLQILQPDTDKLKGTKEIVDHTITELKRISRSYSIPVIVISSINRSNYIAPVDFESLKESGGIEYTCDVCFGLQLKMQGDEDYQTSGVKDKDAAKLAKREALKAEKSKIPREVEIVCLKNRFGSATFQAGKRCLFSYYPQYDCFEPVMPHDNAKIKIRNRL